MELSKRSELRLGSSVYIVSTELAGETTPSIETKVLGEDGSLAFRTSQDISDLRPIFQNSDEVFARLESQHLTVVMDLERGRLTGSGGASTGGASAPDEETQALSRGVTLFGRQEYSQAASALREVLSSYPNCSEARELLEVTYKAASARLPTDLGAALKKGTEAFVAGRQRAAIDLWKQCLAEEPHNRRLQLLVLLSTTWSSERRRRYTHEVLEQEHLHGGRPEEAEALLLLAQTTEDVDAPTVSVPAPFAADAPVSARTEESAGAAPPGEAPSDFETADGRHEIDAAARFEEPTTLEKQPLLERADTRAEADAPGINDFEIEFPVVDSPRRGSEAFEPQDPRRTPPPAPPARAIEMPCELASSGPSPPPDSPTLEPSSAAREVSASAPPKPAPPRAPASNVAPGASVPSPAASTPGPSAGKGTAVTAATPLPAARSDPQPASAPSSNRTMDRAGTRKAESETAIETGSDTEMKSGPATGAVPVATTGAARPAPTPGPPRPGRRRPMGRARGSNPVARYAAIAAAVGGVGLVVAFVLLTGSAVPAGRLEQAEGYVRAGQYGSAIGAYEEILSEFGDHPEVFLGRGRARIAAGSTDQGLSDLMRAYEMSGEPAIAEEIGDVYYSTNRFPDAIEHYAKALESGSGSAEARYRMAVSLLQRARGDEALEHLREATAKDPSHSEAQFLLGELLNERGRYAEAEQALRSAEAGVGRGSDFLTHMGIALLEQGKLDAAEETARAFRLAYPSDARSHSILGEVYLSRGQYEHARAQLIQALRTDRDEPRAQIALGRTWLAIGRARGDAGDLSKAHQVLSQAQGVDEAKRLLALGQVAVAQGDYEAAELWLREALGKGASGLATHLALAESRAHSDDLVGAAEEMQRASIFASEDPAIALSLAVLYSQLDEPDRSMASYLQALRGSGLVTPADDGDDGPVVLPTPYVPLPTRFDINRSIRRSYETVLSERPDDPAAAELKRLAESTSFVIG